MSFPTDSGRSPCVRLKIDVKRVWDSGSVYDDKGVESGTCNASLRSGERKVERARPARRQRLAVAGVVAKRVIVIESGRYVERVRCAGAVVRAVNVVLQLRTVKFSNR